MAAAVRAMELVDRPAAILDRTGRAHMVNTAMERLLGIQRQEVIGRRFRPLLDGATPAWVEQLLRGAIGAMQCTAKTANDRRIALELSISHIGDGASCAVLVTVSSHRTLDQASVPISVEPCFDISVHPDDWGTVRSVDAAAAPYLSQGDRCFQRLFHRDRPCEGCPAIDLPKGGARSTILASPEQPVRLRMIAARSLDGGVARMTVRELEEATLSRLVDAKAEMLAQRAELSHRERDVLKWLLRGRTPQDIGTLLGIAPRTAKFHQANVLRKLGAESRVDLLRLIY